MVRFELDWVRLKVLRLVFTVTCEMLRKTGVIGKRMFDFAAALGGDIFTEKIISPLIKAGALDEFGEPRSVLLASVDAAISHALFIRPSTMGGFIGTVMHSIASPKYSPGRNYASYGNARI